MEEKITTEKIDKLATLSMLYFTDEEKENFHSEVNGIVEMLDKCGEFNVTSLPNERRIKSSDLRTDEVKDSMHLETTMEGINSRVKDYFAVDKVVEYDVK